MKFDFSALNFEVIDANVNANPDLFVNANGLTFTRRVLEEMGYPAHVLCQIDVKNRVFAIRGCKSNELKAFKFSKPKEEQKATVALTNKNVLEPILAFSEILFRSVWFRVLFIELVHDGIVKVTLIECQTSKEQPQSAPDTQVPTEAEEGSSENGDTIAMAMALLVIENTHLREVIRNLRDTISGLTDHKLL